MEDKKHQPFEYDPGEPEEAAIAEAEPHVRGAKVLRTDPSFSQDSALLTALRTSLIGFCERRTRRYNREGKPELANAYAQMRCEVGFLIDQKGRVFLPALEDKR